MKFHQYFFAFLLSLAAFQIISSQEVSNAVLVDEFENISCDDFLARIDNFYIELSNDPSAQGYVVVYGDNSYLRKKLTYELWLNGAIKFRNFDESRITKVRESESGSLKVKLWKVSAGAKKPVFEQTKWNFVFSESAKPFIFYDYFSDQICSRVSFEKVFAEFLKANRDAHGHIVIYEKSAKDFSEMRNKILDLIPEIPKNQLKFFHVKRNESNVEFWLVPRKKK